jgi:cysteine sulfinate desulfinase/cysteine desulfurase-like protein
VAQEDRAHTESLDKQCSAFVEQRRRLCPQVNMESTMEQRVNMNCCVKLQKWRSENLEMLKTVCGESPG